MERSRLNQARTLAQRRNDWNEVAEIDAKLAEAAARTSEQKQTPQPGNVQDLLAKVNERNRKANMEAVRKAEKADIERKKGRKMLAQNEGKSAPVDPSARLKTLPRIFNSNTPVTRLVTICCLKYIIVDIDSIRPGTPVTPAAAAPLPLAPARKNSSFEASLIESVEIDLGDF
jgi:RNA polymerase-associated protein RTF1